TDQGHLTALLFVVRIDPASLDDAQSEYVFRARECALHAERAVFGLVDGIRRAAAPDPDGVLALHHRDAAHVLLDRIYVVGSQCDSAPDGHALVRDLRRALRPDDHGVLNARKAVVHAV